MISQFDAGHSELICRHFNVNWIWISCFFSTEIQITYSSLKSTVIHLQPQQIHLDIWELKCSLNTQKCISASTAYLEKYCLNDRHTHTHTHTLSHTHTHTHTLGTHRGHSRDFLQQRMWEWWIWVSRRHHIWLEELQHTNSCLIRMICSKAAWTSSSMWPYERNSQQQAPVNPSVPFLNI